MATMTVTPEQYIASLPSIVDRTSKQEGATKLANPNLSSIKYNAEIEDPELLLQVRSVLRVSSRLYGCLPVGAPMFVLRQGAFLPLYPRGLSGGQHLPSTTTAPLSAAAALSTTTST